MIVLDFRRDPVFNIGMSIMLTLMLLAVQDSKKPAAHTSPDPKKCKRCLPAYEKAVAYVRSKLKNSTFAATMVCGWLFLADGRYPEDLDHCVKTALQWQAKRGNSQHAQNWYPALAAMFLAEYQKYFPTPEVQKGMQELVD